MLVSSSRTYFPVYAVCPVRCLRELSISLATFRNHATQRCARKSVATATEPCRRTLLIVARVMQISSCAVYEPYYTTCERSVPLQQIRSCFSLKFPLCSETILPNRPVQNVRRCCRHLVASARLQSYHSCSISATEPSGTRY